MKKCYKFNMVEIALAIAVISIGISSILVLFPIGINASRDAMDETGYADAAECIANYVRGKYLDHWREQYDTWKAGDTTQVLNFTYSMPLSTWGWGTGYPGDPTSATEYPNDTEGTDTSTTPKSGLMRSGTAGLFRFTKVGASGEEIFAATVKIWSPADDLKTAATTTTSACPIYVPNTTEDFKQKILGSSGGVQLPDPSGGHIEPGVFSQSALVEISWRDNKRVFRVDVYNPYYLIQSSSTP